LALGIQAGDRVIQKTVHYLEPQLQKIEDVDTGISYWRIEMELEDETPEGIWLVVENSNLQELMTEFSKQLTEHYA
jgi:hypothetical protein